MLKFGITFPGAPSVLNLVSTAMERPGLAMSDMTTLKGPSPTMPQFTDEFNHRPTLKGPGPAMDLFQANIVASSSS